MGYSIESLEKNQNLQKKADLHVHTHLSDSTFSPEEVIKTAKEKGISALAITDHDCVEGIELTICCAEGTGIEVIPAVELTCEWKGYEIHILGYFIDYKSDWFAKRLDKICEDRIRRMEKMIQCLLQFGIDIDIDEVIEFGGSGSVGRLHLAQVLLKNKKVHSLQEAFERFIGNGKPCYIRGFRLTSTEAIGLICKASGIPVLAHPNVMGKDEFIPDFIKAGLRGIEVYHTDHSDKVTAHYKKIAEDFGLLMTGGSDCHGLGKGRTLMGEVSIPYELVERLKQEKANLK